MHTHTHTRARARAREHTHTKQRHNQSAKQSNEQTLSPQREVTITYPGSVRSSKKETDLSGAIKFCHLLAVTTGLCPLQFPLFSHRREEVTNTHHSTMAHARAHRHCDGRRRGYFLMALQHSHGSPLRWQIWTAAAAAATVEMALMF